VNSECNKNISTPRERDSGKPEVPQEKTDSSVGKKKGGGVRKRKDRSWGGGAAVGVVGTAGKQTSERDDPTKTDGLFLAPPWQTEDQSSTKSIGREVHPRQTGQKTPAGRNENPYQVKKRHNKKSKPLVKGRKEEETSGPLSH